MAITGEQAWQFIQKVLPQVRSDVSRMADVLHRSDKEGLFFLDAIMAANTRDELRDIANDINEMIGSKDLKDVA